MYNLGIIGGMGPLATADFYKKLILRKKAEKDSDHINLVVLNHADIPDRSECIQNNTGEVFLSAIKKDFEILEQIGVKAVAIPCNTSHYFFNDFKKMTGLHILNMIEETILEIKKRGYKKAVVFATLGTANAGLYEAYADKHQIEIIELANEEKKQVMKIIYEIKKNNQIDRTDFIDLLRKHCTPSTIGIIACTELSLISLPDELNTIDALDVLIDRCMEESERTEPEDTNK